MRTQEVRREVKQLINLEGVLVALAVDGTVWQYFAHRAEWSRLPELPPLTLTVEAVPSADS